MISVTSPTPLENSFASSITGVSIRSYPYESDNAISSAIPDLFEGYIEGIIGEGVAAVLTAPGNWVGSLSNLEGTFGYWVKVSEPLTFSFISPEGFSRTPTQLKIKQRREQR